MCIHYVGIEYSTTVWYRETLLHADIDHQEEEGLKHKRDLLHCFFIGIDGASGLRIEVRGFCRFEGSINYEAFMLLAVCVWVCGWW